MKYEKGLTWVEALMVIAVIGIVSAIAVPKLVGLSNNAESVARMQAEEAVKTAFAQAIQENQQFPDLVELSEYVDADGVQPSGNGIRVDIHGDAYTILTYSGIDCLSTDRTGDVTDTVRCVGDLVPVN